MNKPEPTPAELIADGIQKISAATQQLLTSGLRKKTIVTLLHAKTGLPQRDISAVLDSLEEMQADWCTP
jgi:hypothetical protein